MNRRRAYHVRLYHVDYFVIKHVRAFVESWIVRCVHDYVTVGDLGCGEQPFRLSILSRGGNYTGVDVMQNAQCSVDVIAPIISVPLPDATFDVILCTEVMEHISDTSVAFREMARLLKPGGKIILTTPFAYPLHEEPQDFVRMTPHQVQKLAQENMLRVMELETAGNELEVLATVRSNLWRYWIGDCSWGRRLILGGLVVASNCVAVVGTTLFGRYFPKRNYLSNLVVLAKQEQEVDEFALHGIN